MMNNLFNLKFNGRGTHLTVYYSDSIKQMLKDLNMIDSSCFWTSTLSELNCAWRFYINSYDNTIEAEGFMITAKGEVRAVAAF